MSMRKKFSQILTDSTRTEEDTFYKGKTLNNFGLNINNYRNNTNKVDKRFYIDKIKKSPNFGYNTEKTDYSSRINDRVSKIQTNSEIRPIYFRLKLNESNNNVHKTETLNFYNSSNNIFNNTEINQKKLYSRTSLPFFRKSFHYYKVNKIDMENVINFSNTLENFQTPQKRKMKHLSNNNNSKNKEHKINNRFNSLNCFIDNYVQFDENKIVNRYIPNFKEYFSNTDYSLLTQKRKKLLTEKEKIKTVFKDTKLMMAMCDYLNLSFSRIKNEKRMKLHSLRQKIKEIKNKNKYIKALNKDMDNNLIPINNIFNMKKRVKNSKANKVPLIYKNGSFYKSFNSLNSIINHKLH